ncbi:hypothetical protein ME9_00435 [Bartonella taylorii 8TBB]|uniref:Uncharacterized protein n=1 Tax=Bartonella taylorii 8TBB TaxID=1094560 RepID=A0A9P2W3E0_BARTA|nr:hypothetical protein ME9_00435 [Bartonella taylorii 8TBB]OPB33653.1 hypothetical protein Btaycd_013340 [Bartonella taylorii]
MLTIFKVRKNTLFSNKYKTANSEFTFIDYKCILHVYLICLVIFTFSSDDKKHTNPKGKILEMSSISQLASVDFKFTEI